MAHRPSTCTGRALPAPPMTLFLTFRHHAEPASPGERRRHRHHHLVRRDRERYDLVDARRDMATRTPRTVRGRLVACLEYGGGDRRQRLLRHLPLGLGILDLAGLQRRHRADRVLRLSDGRHGPAVARRSVRFGGSRSTLIACEKTGRQARLVEATEVRRHDHPALAGIQWRRRDAGPRRSKLRRDHSAALGCEGASRRGVIRIGSTGDFCRRCTASNSRRASCSALATLEADRS